ncbi:MAG: PAS domain S-box protein [Leptolyngbya sp. BL-A-14]
MLNVMTLFAGTNAFIPHGHCYLWQPELVGLHLLSDGLTALAYYSIPLTLFYFVRKRADLPFTWLFLLFSAFIVACGTTHFMAIWTLWHPAYWLAGALKLLTASISVVTAVLLVPIVPKALSLPSPRELEIANWALQQEVAERKRIEAELIRTRDLREAIFNESTDALFLVDSKTQRTLDCNRRAVELFQAIDRAQLLDIEGQTLERHPFSSDERNDIAAEMQLKGFWNREIEFVTCQGNVFWGDIAAKPIAMIAEEKVNLVRITDISERKQHEAEQKEAELATSRLAAIVESSGDAIISKTLDGTITSWNQGAEKLFGYTAEETVGRSIALLLPPEQSDELPRLLEQIQQGNTIEHYETVRLHKNGQRLDLVATISPIKNATGAVIGASKIARDIHQQKQAERSLRESESRFQAFMNNSPAASWITSDDGQMLYMSQTYSRLFQISNDAIGKSIFDLFPLEIAEQFNRNIRQVAETQQPTEVIELAPCPDGTIGQFLVYKFPLQEASGRTCVGGIAVDITEREQAKEQLRLLNDRLQYLLTNAPVAIFSCSVEGDFGETSVSENIRTITGYEPQAFLDDAGFWKRHIHPDDRERILANLVRIFTTGQHAQEYRFLHADGSYRWMYEQLQLMRDAAGNPTEIIGYVMDNSDRKREEAAHQQAKAAIQQSEARYRAIVQDQTELIARFRPDGTLSFVNAAYCRYFGVEPENVIGHHYRPAVFSEDYDRVAQLVNTINQDQPTVIIENRVVVRGEVRWTQWVNHALFDPQGTLVEVQAVGRDTHDLKQAEEALRESEKRLQLALEASGDGLWDWNIQTDSIYNNARYSEMLGYDADELPQETSTWEQLVHPDDMPWVKELLDAHLKESSVAYKFDYRLRTKTGQWKWVANYGKVVAWDEQGNPLRMIGTHRDVDDRKRAEQALQEREAFLRAIGDNIPNGYLYQLLREQDGSYRYTYVSAGVERASGLKPKDILADSSLMFKLVVEDDLPYLLQKGEESAQNLSIFDVQIREQLPNGEHCWLRLCAAPRHLDDGRVLWDGIRLDINDLKQTEETLRQSEERWQLAISGSNDGIWDHNLQTNEQYLSPRCLEIVGYDLDEVNTFEKWLQHVHPSDAARLQATYQAHIGQHVPHYTCEYKMQCKDGTEKWLLERGQILWDEQGTPLRAVGSLTDISDRKRTEEALHQSEAKNRAMLVAIPDLLLRLKRDGTCLDFIPPTAPQAGAFLPIKQHISEILPADLLQNQLQRMEQALATGELQVWEHQLIKDGKPQDEEIRLVPCGEDEVLLIVRDITERNKTQAALRQSEVKNRALVQAIPDLLIRMKRDGTYLDVQESGTVLLPRNSQPMVGKNIYDILPATSAQERIEYAQQALQTHVLQVYEYEIDIDGEVRFEEARIAPCGEDEVLVIVRDISDRKRSEAERKQAEEALRRYEQIVSATTDAIALIDKNYVYQVVNQSYLDWYSKPQHEIVGHAVSEFLPKDVYETTVKPHLEKCLTGQVIQYEMWADYTAQGSQFLSITYDPIYNVDRSVVGVVTSLRNITRLKQAEVELELQSLIARNMAEGVCIVGVNDGLFVYTNPKFERMFGYDEDELIGQHVSIVNYEDKHANTTETYQRLAKNITDRGEATYEIHNVKKDGTSFWCQATTSVFEHPHYGAVFVVVQQDITERKQTEAIIQASLKEKEVLLKEIHHRVKNNLGIVDGLLQMQSRRSSDPQVIVTLQESQNRIASIALVHEKLYGSDDLANIDFAQYIADLTAHLFDAYNTYANQVKLTTHIEATSLDIDTAIPCGLIINELLSNALKYAFPNGQRGEIQVIFQAHQDQTLSLCVQDNGIGLPQDFNLKQAKTLGITLVKGLVKQLKGTLDINSHQGTAFEISFRRT